MKSPGLLDTLILALRRLPGVGPKSAQRYAYHLLQHDREGAEQLSRALSAALEGLNRCRRCNTFSDDELCETCASPRRDASQLCVVETPADQAALERTGSYRGLYFVLMGRLSPLDGVGPRELHLDRLLQRAQEEAVGEIILATNFTHEGEATAHYLAEMLRARGRTVTRIAQGLPAGGELEHVDSGTLAQAMLERRPAP